MAAQLAPLLTVELMPYFLKKPFSWAMTIGRAVGERDDAEAAGRRPRARRSAHTRPAAGGPRRERPRSCPGIGGGSVSAHGCTSAASGARRGRSARRRARAATSGPSFGFSGTTTSRTPYACSASAQVGPTAAAITQRRRTRPGRAARRVGRRPEMADLDLAREEHGVDPPGRTSAASARSGRCPGRPPQVDLQLDEAGAPRAQPERQRLVRLAVVDDADALARSEAVERAQDVRGRVRRGGGVRGAQALHRQGGRRLRPAPQRANAREPGDSSAARPWPRPRRKTAVTPTPVCHTTRPMRPPTARRGTPRPRAGRERLLAQRGRGHRHAAVPAHERGRLAGEARLEDADAAASRSITRPRWSVPAAMRDLEPGRRGRR